MVAKCMARYGSSVLCLLYSILIPVMLMTKATMAVDLDHSPDSESLTLPEIGPGSNYSRIYLALYDYARERSNGQRGTVIDISPIMEDFFEQFRHDVVFYDRYTFLFPDLRGTFPDGGLDVLAEFSNGIVTGSHTLGLDEDGKATLTFEDDMSIQLDLPLQLITGDLLFDVDLKLGPFKLPRGVISGFIVGPTKYLLGVRVSPWGGIRITELLIVYKGEVEAEVTGWGGFIKWMEALFYIGIIFFVLFLILVGVCIYLVFKLRKQSALLKTQQIQFKSQIN